MSKMVLYFEAANMATDEQGKSCPAGLTLDLGEMTKPIDYKDLAENIDVSALIHLINLDGIIDPKDIKVITPEEYAAEYGEDDDR